MTVYIKKRLLGFVIVLAGVSILSFLLIALSGTDPAEVIARRSSVGATDEMVQQVRVEMGLDKPLHIRYFQWLAGLLTGNLGISIYSFRPIREDIAAFLPTTLALVGLSFIWIIVISVPVSLLCARRKDGIFDHITRGITLLGICLPTFWLGFLLLMAFAVRLPIFSVVPSAGLKGLLLPSFTLAVPLICAFIRMFRSSLLGELGRDYVVYAKARGLPPGRILLHHVMRNALPPIITLLCQYLGYLIAGGAVVESVFSISGIGTYLIACVIAADTTAVASCIMIIATVFVLSNLAGDIINRLLCPWMVRETNG